MVFMEVREVKIGDLFSDGKKTYKVPIYQRPYAWKDDQWNDLFEDLINLPSDDNHFLGSVVLVTESLKNPNSYNVVDGQQRLTTLFIWLSAIRDMVEERGDIALANFITKSYLFVNDFKDGEVLDIPKLQLGKLDNEEFLKVLHNGKKDSEHSIYNCYNYFKQIPESGDIWEKILNNISIVLINAQDELNAFRLFETLNDRGLELSAADLIKNFILMKVASNKVIFKNTIAEWDEMYENIREWEPVKFIRRYVLSSYKGKISETRLYDELKKRINTYNNNEILSFVKKLNSASIIYKKINEANFDSDKINIALKKLHLIEVSPSYVLLLKVFSDLNSGNYKNILEIIDLIETFHIRWGVCGLSTSKLDQIYNSMCNGLSQIDKEDYLDYIKEAFSKEIMLNADDERFKRNFISKKFTPNEKRTKYILWKLSDPTGETNLNINNVQTEHIMPQKLSKEWKEELAKDYNNEEIEALHNEKLNLIGNLTIIKTEWNQSMSNRPFESKKSRLWKI